MKFFQKPTTRKPLLSNYGQNHEYYKEEIRMCFQNLDLSIGSWAVGNGKCQFMQDDLKTKTFMQLKWSKLVEFCVAYLKWLKEWINLIKQFRNLLQGTWGKISASDFSRPHPRERQRREARLRHLPIPSAEDPGGCLSEPPLSGLPSW